MRRRRWIARCKRMRILLVALASLALLLSCALPSVPGISAGPEKAAQEAFESWAENLGILYTDATVETLSDDGAHATVRVTAKFEDVGEQAWLDKQADIGCWIADGEWKCDSSFLFSLTQEEEERRRAAQEATVTAMEATREAEATAVQVTAVAQATENAAAYATEEASYRQLWEEVIEIGDVNIDYVYVTEDCSGDRTGCRRVVARSVGVSIQNHDSVAHWVSLEVQFHDRVVSAVGVQKEDDYTGNAIWEGSLEPGVGQITLTEQAEYGNNPFLDSGQNVMTVALVVEVSMIDGSAIPPDYVAPSASRFLPIEFPSYCEGSGCQHKVGPEQPVVVWGGWIADSQELVRQGAQAMTVNVTVDGQPQEATSLAWGDVVTYLDRYYDSSADYDDDADYEMVWRYPIGALGLGSHQVEACYDFLRSITDGLVSSYRGEQEFYSPGSGECYYLQIMVE
ncbi:MAG TPA: hypothetical protein VMW58_04415 [Anaerolineae bacterium]|nr:hypothetical protein [Anaerolineae bacterium]